MKETEEQYRMPTNWPVVVLIEVVVAAIIIIIGYLVQG